MRNWLKLICLTFVCVLLGASPAFAEGNTLVIGITQAPKSMDPQSTSDAQSFNHALQYGETLVKLDEKGFAHPLLAERWEVGADKQTFIFHLKKGVKFHDGETMTADDVVFTFERAMSPQAASIRTLAGQLAGVRKIDDYTIELKSKQPMDAVFLMSVAHPWASIMSKKAVEKWGKDYNQHPVGTGKFKFVHYYTGDRVEFERFDDYHGEPAKYKKLILRAVLEASSRAIELESGAVDFIVDVAPVDLNRIKDNPKLEATAAPGSRLYYMAYDLLQPPYNDLRVRQALSLATNREGMCKVVFRGYAKPARGMETSAVKYAKYDETPPFEFNLKKAKQLLTEAGYPNGFKMKLMISERADWSGLATIMQADYKQIGIDVEIEVYEWGAFLDVIYAEGHAPFLLNWWGGPPAMDPFFLLQPVHHSNARPTPNRTNYVNKRVDELFDKGMALPDGPERAAVYGEVWDILNADLPWVPILEVQSLYGQKKILKGVPHSPGIMNYYGDAYFVK